MITVEAHAAHCRMVSTINNKSRGACNDKEGARTAMRVDKIKPEVGTEGSLDFVRRFPLCSGFPWFSFCEQCL